jgi:hypothetical protein
MGLLELEARVKAVSGVLGCVIVADADDHPAEIQAFTRAGEDRTAIRARIETEVASLEPLASPPRVLVFELETESLLGGPDALRQAELLAELEVLTHEGADAPVREPGVTPQSSATGDRPVLRRVVSLSTTPPWGAEVFLGSTTREVVGRAVGTEAAHGLGIVAEAALDAVHKLIGQEGTFTSNGTWVAEALGREVVLSFVESAEGEVVGAALVRGGSLSEAAVRATLDAVNRRLARMR